MIISVKWLQDYVDIDMPIDELATLIGARLVEIEKVVDYGAKFTNAVIAKVVYCQPLEGSDHLNITKLDDGGAVANVDRDENGLVQVVCGASNVREGIMVVWLPPGSVVPETHGTNEPFMLGARKLRGVMSNGMIASARELALSDEHEGILEINDTAPGTMLVDLLHFDDTLLDIENKSLTHRPDAFGVIGFAREIAGIQGEQFETPEWLKTPRPVDADRTLGEFIEPKVSIDDPMLADRYQGIIITNVDGTMPAPITQQTYLTRVGVRPISAIVDMTNFLMLETGQPLHAFDYDKLAAVNNGEIDIHVRAGRENETLKLLDGRNVTLTSDDIVIANGETAVALAGAMGGADTEVDETTKTIFLESATFNLYNLRATQMRHGIFSEAITRFTKGQPAELTAPVLALGTKLLGSLMDARPVSSIVEAYPGKKDPIVIELTIDKINSVLGTNLSREYAAKTLRNVEFEVRMEDTALYVTVPYWRNDIHIPEDLIEEIGRLNGFDSISPALPGRDFTAVAPDAFDELRARIRTILARAGANEVLTYSFVHGNLLEKAGQKREDSYRITNSISPDLQYYRQSLSPSLLHTIHGNVKQGYDTFSLFELNKAHPKQHGLTDEGVPVEVDMLSLVVASKNSLGGAAYYHARRILDFMATQLGLDLAYEPIENDPGYPVTSPFDHRRAALVTDKKTGTFLGIVGEYKPSVKKAFKLPDYCAGFELGAYDLFDAVRQLASAYTPLSRFPGTERDICFQVTQDVRYAQIIEAVKEVLDNESLEVAIKPVDIYQPENGLVKNITIRIKLVSRERTLTSDDASAVVSRVVHAVTARTNATVI